MHSQVSLDPIAGGPCLHELSQPARCRFDFMHDGECGIAGIGGSGDGAADNKIIRAGACCFSGRSDARLVVRGSAGRTHRRDERQESRAAGAADRGDLVGGGNRAVKPCGLGHQRQRHGARAHIAGNAHAAQRGGIEARQDRDAEEQRPPLATSERLACRAHHGYAARRVQRQQADARQLRRGANSAGNGVRDVVKFQIEKNFGPGGGDFFNGAGAFGGEELAANLEEVGDATKPPGQLEGWPQAVNVQRDDQSRRSGAVREGTSSSSRRTLASPLWSNPSLRATS